MDTDFKDAGKENTGTSKKGDNAAEKHILSSA
jgi:hypothetical protein